MAGYHVYSTLTSDVTYTGYTPREGDLPILDHSVFIKGGSGLADKKIITPYGVHTEISERDYEVMMADQTCQLHMKNGFIRIESKKYDPERVAADMQLRDKSAPLVPEDFDMESTDIETVKPVLSKEEIEVSEKRKYTKRSK